MSKSDMGSHFKKIKKEAKSQGWVIDQTSKGHWRFKPPHPGEIVVMSGSPSEPRAVLNFVATLRRNGLQLQR